jgi:uncharacterized Zn finger protein
MPARRSAPRPDIVYDDDYSPRRYSDDHGGDWWSGRGDEERKVQRELERRRAAGESLRAEVPGHARNLSTTFWGQAWNRNLMAYSDYESRLPRGRSYFRAGKVLDLAISKGLITAIVAGTRIYSVRIAIAPLSREAWQRLKARCQGKIGGLMELLSGTLSDEVMREVTDLGHGLFPAPRDMKLNCTCPDFAGLCKHLAATLYATGSRLDSAPAVLFALRGTDPEELIGGGTKEAVASLTSDAEPADAARTAALAGMDLTEVFGIEPDILAVPTVPVPAGAKTKRKRPARDGKQG